MDTTIGRQLLAAALLSAALAGCGRQAAEVTPSTPQPAAPTAAISALTTPAAPTAAPAATQGATPAPADDKLPALSSGAWRELGRGDASGDGADELILYLPSDTPAEAAFAANYAPGQVAVADVVVMAQTYEGSEIILLQADRTGIAADVALWRAPQSAPPAAYMVAYDPGSSFLLSLLPLSADGSRQREPIPLDWSAGEGALRVPQLPPPGQGAVEELPAAQPTGSDFTEIAQAVHERLSVDGLERPAIVGATAVAGDYAAAIAGVFLEERPRQLILGRGATGAWEVLLDSADRPAGAGPALGAAELSAVGAPASLAEAHELSGLFEAASRHLQDPRGQGLAGHLQLERLDQGYAKLTFVPTERMVLDPFTMFFGPGEGGWTFLTGGTAFMGPELDQLGIPQSVR